jgi:insulysin
MLWQWIHLIKRAVETDPGLMAQYHSELRQIASNDFRFRENGDPSDFCSRAAEMLFKYEPSHILIGSAAPNPYNSTVTQQFMSLFHPKNCIVQITSSDFKITNDDEWKLEPYYR